MGRIIGQQNRQVRPIVGGITSWAQGLSWQKSIRVARIFRTPIRLVADRYSMEPSGPPPSTLVFEQFK